MKCIIKAMSETEFKPRAKWWGFTRDGFRYLCRYEHIFCVFHGDYIVSYDYQTKTDKAGVLFALKYFEEQNEIKNK